MNKRLIKIIAVVAVIGLFFPALLRVGDWVANGDQPFTRVEADNGKQQEQTGSDSQSGKQDKEDKESKGSKDELVEVTPDSELKNNQITVTVVKGALNFKEITVHSTGVNGAAGFEVEGFIKPIGESLTLMLVNDKVDLTLIDPKGETLAKYTLDFTKDYTEAVIEAKE